MIGGGVGGLAAVQRLASAGRRLDITLIEPNATYTTCFFSNLHLAGLRTLDSLTHSYAALNGRPGLTVVRDRAVAIDPALRAVTLAGRERLGYDRLVVAPGVDFDFSTIDGYDETATGALPHAWNAGAQTGLLRHQIVTMRPGGLFIMAVPAGPMRCPPAPYERACLIAHVFKQANPSAKILILDGKDSFVDQDLFQDAWRRHYPGMIEWLPGQFTGGVKAVDAKARTIATDGEQFKFDVANIIPPQRAGVLAQEAGLADDSRWCPIDPWTFGSRLQPNIHVIGDATTAGAMPKSATAAFSQGEACADAIRAALQGDKPTGAELRSDCFSFLAPDDVVRNRATFMPEGDTIVTATRKAGSLGDSAALRRQTAGTADTWYSELVRALFD